MSLLTAECERERQSLTYIYVTISICLVSSMLVIVGMTIKDIYLDKSTKTTVKCWGLAVSFGILIGMVVHCVYLIDYCIEKERMLDEMDNFFYILQCLGMLCIWFIRIDSPFTGTIYRIHKIKRYIYIISFVFLFILATFLSFSVSYIDGKLWSVFVTILGSFYVLTLVSLSVLFINKLLRVYRQHNKLSKNCDAQFVDLLTKMTLLNFMSLFVTIACTATFILLQSESTSLHFVNHFGLLFDYYTNFLCVLFSFKHYDKYYMICCGGMHKQCSKCVFGCVTGKTAMQIAEKGTSQDQISPTSNGVDL